MPTPQITDVNMAYEVARKIAASLFSKHAQVQEMLDFEDFVQEGMLAWWEGSVTMYNAMMDAFRRASKLSRYSYVVKGMTPPYELSYNDEMFEGPNITEDEIIEHLDSGKVLERINAIKDSRTKFIVQGNLYFGMSYRELGEVLDLSHERIRQILEPELEKLRKEFAEL
jgi:RNA polymerase sigma factor (sigma-70 family)